ncbi:MAG: lytic transglycosylase domain-containing protein [Synergistaceae bacterium]|jgi:soluble lytic murein transglycosylase-like protein|nr:lytic transglycosylase domain-containing protein [Synergistaceae bacterium]
MKRPARAAALAFLLALLALLALLIMPARAELERYDTPKFRPPPVKLVFPVVRPRPAASPAAEQQKPAAPKRDPNEARLGAIARLFRHYNKKLTDKQAREYAALTVETAERFGHDPCLIAAIVVTESSARNDVVSRGGDYGLMQVRWRVHQKSIRARHPHIAKAKDMFSPKNNLTVGTEIFSACHKNAGGDVHRALLLYSAGNKGMAAKVLKRYAALKKSAEFS